VASYEHSPKIFLLSRGNRKNFNQRQNAEALFAGIKDNGLYLAVINKKANVLIKLFLHQPRYFRLTSSDNGLLATIPF